MSSGDHLITGLLGGAALLGISWIVSRWTVRKDARPRPLGYSDVINEAFCGDLISLPAEAKIGGAANSRAGSGKADATDIQGMHRTHSERSPSA